MPTEPALRSFRASLARYRISPWLIIAMAIGLVRFLNLEVWSLWFDEALTVSDAWHGAPNSYHEAGYRAIFWTVEALGGTVDEANLRLLPALIGYLAIPVFYWAFLPIAGPRRMGVAVTLLAASSWQQYWSQNARGYTMTEFAGLLGAGVLLRALQKGHGPMALAGLLMVGTGSFFHPHAAVLAAGMVLGLAVYAWTPAHRESMKPPLKWVCVGVGLGLAWQGTALWEAFGNYRGAVGGGGVGSLVHLVKSTAFFLAPVVGVGVWAGALQVLFTGSKEGQYVLAVVLSTASIIAGLSFFGVVSAQYLFGLHPWMLVLAAWPVGSKQLFRGARWAYMCVLILPCLAQLGLYSTVRMGERPRWREAYDYVWNHRAEDDLILGMQAGLGDFYLEPGFTEVRRPQLVGATDRSQPQHFRRARGEARATWLVIRPAFLELWGREDRRELRAFLARQCHLIKRFPLPMEGRNLDLEIYYKPGL